MFSNAGSISGNIVGGGGTDTLDLSAYTSTVTVTLGTTTSTVTSSPTTPIQGNFSGISSFVANNSVATNTLVGPNVANTWNIGKVIEQPDSGTLVATGVGTFTFSKLENLTGGSGNDTFVFYTGGSI